MLLAVLLLAAFQAHAAPSPGCWVNVNTDLPKKNDPVYLAKGNQGLELVLPDAEGNIRVASNKEVVAACTGKASNSLKTTGSGFSVVTCRAPGPKFSVDLTQSSCTDRSAASLKITGKKCSDDKHSVLIEAGFSVEGEWYPLLESCHDMEEGRTHWSRHSLHGDRLRGKVIQSDRPGFARGDKALYKGFNPDNSYKQATQEEVFKGLYNKDGYIGTGPTLYLARGHLAPDADFLLAAHQMATYFYVNAAPQWQSINQGSWLAVENNARKAAANRGRELIVVTGTEGTLSLATKSKTKVEAYLESDRLPVPAHYWKLLLDPKDSSCVVLISTNNPYLTKRPETMCPDVCSKAGWPELQSDLQKGYVYCCEYKEFRKAVANVPDLKCTKLMNF